MRPGQTVSNCLPQGIYDVRIEYYERKPFIGDWLLYSYEFKVSLLYIIFESVNPYSNELEISSIPVVNYLSAMTRTVPTNRDHLKMHGHLFALYGVLIALLFATLIVFIRTLRKHRPN